MAELEQPAFSNALSLSPSLSFFHTHGLRENNLNTYHLYRRPPFYHCSNSVKLLALNKAQKQLNNTIKHTNCAEWLYILILHLILF